jgi:myosin-5
MAPDLQEQESGVAVAATAEEGAGQRKQQQQLASSYTVSLRFRKQLDELIKTLRSTEPHYVKTIKPNNAKAPKGWSPELVVRQLRYSGALEVGGSSCGRGSAKTMCGLVHLTSGTT